MSGTNGPAFSGAGNPGNPQKVLRTLIVICVTLIFGCFIAVIFSVQSEGRARSAEAQIAAQKAEKDAANAALFVQIYGRPPVAGKPSPPYYKASTQKVVRERLLELIDQEERVQYKGASDGSCREALYKYGRPFFEAKSREAIQVAQYFDYDTDLSKK